MTNPIIQREFIGLLRRPPAFLLQVLLAGLLALLVALRWPADAQVNLSGEETLAVFRIFGYGLFTMTIAFAPLFPAVSIVRERQAGTLTLLLNSPLSPLSVLTGKLVGGVGYTLVLLVMSLPAAAACWSMGGIAFASQLCMLYALLALAACQYVSIALFISTRAASPESAIRTTYLLIFVLVVVVLGPYQLKGGLLGPEWSQIFEWLRCVSPLPALMDLLGHSGLTTRGLQSGSTSGFRFIVLATATIVLANTLTWRQLSRWMLDRPRPRAAATDDRSAFVRFYRRVMFLWFFDPQRRSRLIGNFTNPVMAKEFRSNRFGRSHWMARLVIICMIVSLALMLIATRSTTDWGADALAAALVLLQVGMIVFVTPTLACGIISAERERGGWDLLRMTPLPARRIITGKLLAVATRLAILVMATFPGYIAMVLIEPAQLPRATRVAITLALVTVFAIALSAACSSLCRQTIRAMAATYGLLLALCLGTLLVWFAQGQAISPSLVRRVLMLNPLAACFDAMGMSAFTRYDLLPGAWIFLGAGSFICFVILIVNTWRLTRPT